VVLKSLLRVLHLSTPMPIVGRADGMKQIVRIDSRVLDHVFRDRQTSPWAKEAGGQLFGSIGEAEVWIHRATGPYVGDERSRHGYRSCPAAAQRAIDAQAIAGLLYLGEWHTHAEDHPNASSLDKDAMDRLLTRSRLNSNALFMLIAGRVVGPDGLALFSVDGSSEVTWKLALLNDASTSDACTLTPFDRRTGE